MAYRTVKPERRSKQYQTLTVSPNEQNLDLQIDAFLKGGIDNKNIYTDKVSSTIEERRKLGRLLDYVREGDTIAVWRLDRLARSLIHFTKLMIELDEKVVKFKSIPGPFIDTTKSLHIQNFF